MDELEYHGSFTPKYRKKFFAHPEVAQMCIAIFKSICEKRGWHIISINTDVNHLHLAFCLPASVSVSYAKFILKGSSSHELRQKIPFLKKEVKDHFWAPHSFVKTIGSADREVVKRYIENQGLKREAIAHA